MRFTIRFEAAMVISDLEQAQLPLKVMGAAFSPDLMVKRTGVNSL